MPRRRLAKSLEVFRDQVNEMAPNRSKASDSGLWPDAAHQAVASSHNPNSLGVVTAFDLTHDPSHGMDAHKLADMLIKYRHPELNYVISNGRIAGWWTRWKWTQYTGDSPHDKHIHVDVGTGDDGDKKRPYDSTQPWKLTEGYTMDEQDVKDINYHITGEQATAGRIKLWKGKDPREFIKALVKLQGFTPRAAQNKTVTQLRAKVKELEKASKLSRTSVVEYVAKNLK